MSPVAKKSSSKGSLSSQDKAREPARKSWSSATDQPANRSFLDRLPLWVSTNLRSLKSWKVLFRCWVAFWAAFVLLLSHKSLDRLGQVAFFVILTGYFIPPSLPIQLFIIIISTIVLGLLLSWGLGAAAIRAGDAARNKAHLQLILQQVQSSISSNPADQADPAAALKAAIFKGVFLDIKSTAVYGCMLGVGAVVFGLARAYAPKLQLFSIFGTIGIDIFCTIGPLLPTPEYTILNSVLKSVASYMAIAILATIFIFPETMNHLCMSMISAQLAKANALILLQDEVLTSDLEGLAPGSPLIAKVNAVRATIIGEQQQLMAMSGNINLEFSRGKWNGDDVRELEEPLLKLVVRMVGLLGFAKFSGAHCGVPLEVTETNSTGATASVDIIAAPTSNDSYVFRQIHQHRHAIEITHSLRFDDILPLVQESTADLRRACTAAITAVQTSLDSVNTRRWKTNGELDSQHTLQLDEATVRLRAELVAFKEIHRKRLVEPFLPLIYAAKTSHEQEMLPLRSLYLAYVFGTNLILSSDAILALMDKVTETTHKRLSNRFWAPKGLRAIGKLFTARGDKDDGAFGEDTSPIPDASTQREEPYARDPDSKPPANGIQKIMNSIHKLWKWLKTAEGVFTVKYVIISIALWIPSVCKSSASFFYDQKGIWALIMGQTILNVYAGDQVFNLFIRTMGTLVGLIFGLLAWYIGNGNGKGNVYGSAASYALVSIPVIFLRVFGPTKYLAGIVLSSATFALVVGYSWVDDHTIQVFTPGAGWSVAWKRWTLVMIGSGASFILMMLPPKSGRKAVRIRNASSVAALSKIYGFLISTWISDSSHDKEAAASSDWSTEFRTQLIAQALEIDTIKELTDLATWEGSIRGAWPSEEYLRLSDVQTEMISGLGQLGGALGHLEDNWRLTFLHSTRVLNPHFIIDVMSMFSLVSQSLRTGQPMHQVLPSTLVERLFYHHRRDHAWGSLVDKRYHIDVDHIQSLDYMYYANGLVAVYRILQSLDELHKITRRLCGEVPLQGFAAWRDDYERTHIPV